MDRSATIAAGIGIVGPVRGAEVRGIVESSGGTMLAVSNDDIRAAVDELARIGFTVEPTAAVPVAALSQAPPGTLVIPISSGRRI